MDEFFKALKPWENRLDIYLALIAVNALYIGLWTSGQGLFYLSANFYLYFIILGFAINKFNDFMS